MPRATLVNELRLIGAAGTNKVMAGELSRLARRASIAQRLGTPRKEGLGSLVYAFDPELAALAVRYHRTASRALWDLFRSRAVRLEPLYDDLLGLMSKESRGWLGTKLSISVNARGVQEFAAGERQVVGTVKNAVVDGATKQGKQVWVDPDNPDVHLAVRLFEGAVTVSVDLAGRPMNQRGYRLSGQAAPLRENLAAVLVMLARHDARNEALVDPMAGTGTIAVEAACMASARPLWVPPREPACATLPPFRRWFAEPAQPLFADTRAAVFANDIARPMVPLCRKHVRLAGVEESVECRAGNFRNWDADELRAAVASRGLDPSRGLILSNPPYGERIGDQDLVALYKDLGAWCRQFSGWRAGFITVNPEFEQAFGSVPRIKKPLSNGPFRGYFLLYDL